MIRPLSLWLSLGGNFTVVGRRTEQTPHFFRLSNYPRTNIPKESVVARSQFTSRNCPDEELKQAAERHQPHAKWQELPGVYAVQTSRT